MADDFTAKKETLYSEIEEYMQVMNGRSNRHRHGNTYMNIGRVIISVVITVIGVQNQSYWIAALGAILTGLTVIQEMFPLAEMAFFYRAVLGDLEELKDQLKFIIDDDQEELEKAVKRFSEIKKHVAREVPRGSHVKTIKTFD